MLPAIERFERDAVRFVDGVVRRFDRVIACTGYRADLAALAPAVAACVDANGYPRGFAGTGAASGLYWLGFDPYAPGGVLASIRRDAPRVAAAIAAGSRAA